MRRLGFIFINYCTSTFSLKLQTEVEEEGDPAIKNKRKQDYTFSEVD
jgi:hypothetical protein